MTPILCLVLIAPLAEPGAGGCEGPEVASPCASQEGELHPGDLVFFRRRCVAQNIMYYLLLSGGMTHAGIVVALPDGSLALLETPGMGYPVIFSDIHSRMQSYPGRTWVRHRRIPLTAEQSARLTAFACRQEGKPFDKMRLFAPTFGGPVHCGCGCPCDPEVLDSPRWICSSLIVAAGVSAGLLDPCKVRPRTTAPQDLFSDRHMDLSRCWQAPQECLREGPRTHWWWSRSSTGECQVWP